MVSQFYQYIKIWENQWLSEDKLKALQLLKLKKLIKYAKKNVPYYTELFRNIGLNENDIRSLEDIKKIPVLNKQIIKDAGDDLISKKFGKENIINQKTGGSSGQPMNYYRNINSFNISRAAKLRTFITNGFKINWSIAELHGFYLKSNSKFYHRFGIHKTINIDAEMSIKQQYDMLKLRGVKCFDAFPNRIEALAKFVLENNLRDLEPELIFTNSETLNFSVRSLVLKAFNKHIIDIYGNTECQFIAWQCKEHKGYHINADLIIVEVDNERTSFQGEIITTDLTNYVQPLIRYNTEDVGEFSDEKCTCGRTLPILKKIEGRKNHFLVLPSGRIISGTQYIDSILLHYSQINQFKAKQYGDKSVEIFINKNNDSELNESLIIKKIKNDLEDIPVKISYSEKFDKTYAGKFIIFSSDVKLN